MKTVLILDKEDSIRKALKLYFTRQGYITSTVKTLSEAQSLMAANSYDTVIMDVQLSDGNSMELYKEEEDNAEETNYIFTSAFPEKISGQTVRNMEDVSFLEKPFTLNQLSELLTPEYGKDIAIAV